MANNGRKRMNINQKDLTMEDSRRRLTNKHTKVTGDNFSVKYV